MAGEVPGERDGHSAAIIGEQVQGLLLLDANYRPIFFHVNLILVFYEV